MDHDVIFLSAQDRVLITVVPPALQCIVGSLHSGLFSPSRKGSALGLGFES